MTDNPRIGSSLDDFLETEGIVDEVNARAKARVTAWIERRDRYILAAMQGLLAKHGDIYPATILAVKAVDYATEAMRVADEQLENRDE